MCRMIGTFNICANFMVVYISNLVDQDDYRAWLLTRESTCTGAWSKIDFGFYTVLGSLYIVRLKLSVIHTLKCFKCPPKSFVCACLSVFNTMCSTIKYDQILYLLK